MSLTLTDGAPARAAEPDRLPFGDRTVDLTAEPPPITWAVESFAARGALTVLAAPPSTGKTELALQLADATYRGDSVAGLGCASGRALYVDGENGTAIVAQRVRDGRLDPGAFVYVDGTGLAFERPDDRRELADAIRHHGATFVVLDSLRRLTPSVREDSSDDMAPLVGALATVARETNAAVLLLHHRSTKGRAAAVRGSSAIEDQADLVFTLSGRPPKRQQLATTGKYRLGRPPEPLTLRLHDDPLGFVADAPVAAQSDLTRAIAALAERVRADGSWTTAQIAQAVGIDTHKDGERRRLNRALAGLVESGEWERPARGQYVPV